MVQTHNYNRPGKCGQNNTHAEAEMAGLPRQAAREEMRRPPVLGLPDDARKFRGHARRFCYIESPGRSVLCQAGKKWVDLKNASTIMFPGHSPLHGQG